MTEIGQEPTLISEGNDTMERPDRFEIVVRAVCGSLVGAVAGFCLSVQMHVSSFVILCITIILSAGFAGCAAALGDDFWG